MDIPATRAAQSILPSDLNLAHVLIAQNRQIIARIVETIPLTRENLPSLIQALPPNAAIEKDLTALKAELEAKPNATINLPTLVKLVTLQTASRSPLWALIDKQFAAGDLLALANTNNQLTFKHVGTAETAGSQEIGARTVFSVEPALTRQIESAMRQYLPVQDSGLTLLKNIDVSALPRVADLLKLAETNGSQAERLLSQFIQSIATKLQHAAPISPEIPTSQLAKQIANSGSFLETGLKNLIDKTQQPEHTLFPDKGLLNSDTKAILLGLLNASQLFQQQGNLAKPEMQQIFDTLFKVLFGIRPTSTQSDTQAKNDVLIQKFESLVMGSLAKISANQLQSLLPAQNEPSSQLLWNTDVFLRVNDYAVPFMFQCWLFNKKEKEGKQKESKRERHWKINIAWEFPNSGNFSAEVIYNAGKVSSKIWVEDLSLREKFKKNMHTLFERLKGEGIEIEKLSCTDEQILAKESVTKTSLIDVRT